MPKNRCSRKIPVARLEATIDKLDELDKKPKAELSLRETIHQLRHKLNRALKKGYSYQDLSLILKEQHIIIAPRTLQQYLTDTKKRAVSKPRSSTKILDKASSNSSQDNTSLQDSPSTNYQQTQETSEGGRESHLITTSSNISTDAEAKTIDTQSPPQKSVKGKFTRRSSSSEDLSNEFNQY